MAHTTIKVQCVDQTLQATSRPTIASGGIDENVVEFSFCELWDGFTKTAVFYQDIDLPYYAALDASDSCVIPWEALQTDGTLYIGVFGTNADEVTRTTELLRYKIAKGAITEGLVPSDPTPELWEQILAQVAATNSSVQQLAADMSQYNQALQGLEEKHDALDTEVQELSDRVDSIGTGGDDSGGDLIVTITGDTSSGFTADKTYDEIKAAYSAGRWIYASFLNGGSGSLIPLTLFIDNMGAIFQCAADFMSAFIQTYTITPDTTVSGTNATIYPENHLPTPKDLGAQAQHAAKTATLAVASWSNNAQTVSVSGVTASNTVIVSPAPASHEAYAKAGVYCSAQASGKLTFTCKNVPSAALTVNVIVLGV